MTDLNETAEQPAKTAKKSPAKRAPKKAAKPDAPFASSLPANTQKPTVDELEREIRETELELARVNLEKARGEVSKFKEDKRTREQKAERAQQVLADAKRAQDAIKAGCTHRLGGMGLEDTYNGDRESALAVMDMPAPNAKYVLCVRCMGEWRTPDPNLKRTDPERYADQLSDWKDCLQLLRNAKIKPMAGPTFMFSDSEGRPVHPQMV